MRILKFTPIVLTLLFNTALAAPAPPPAKVIVKRVVIKEVSPTQQLTGLVDFDRVSAVSGEVSGLITGLKFGEGSHVKQNDPLVELNNDLIQKDKDIKRKQIAQAASDIEKVGQTLKRLKSLLRNNSASRQAYDDARFDYRSLQKKRETLEQEMERLQLQENKGIVRAPFDGIILEKLKETGEWLIPGSAVCRIASTNDLVVSVAVPESLIRYQQLGTAIPVSIPSLGQRLEGHIRAVGPIASKRSRSVNLKIVIPYSKGLLQNLTAEVEVSSGIRQTLQWLPRDALVHKGGKDLVYTVVNNQSKAIPITVIARTATEVGVNSPMITADTSVVVNGNDRLRPNQSVTVISP